MRLVSIKSIKSGDKIAISITAPNGNRILSAGAVFNESYVDRLAQMGIKYTFIEDERFNDIIFKDPININTRINSIQFFKVSLEAINKGRDINEDKVKDVIKAIVDDVKSTGNPLAIINSMYPTDAPLIDHAINTAIISVAMGISLGYNFNQLCDICLSGLTHDLGRDEETNDDDQTHAQKGFDILRKYRTLNLNATIVSFEHHENFDGSGFPRALKGTAISEYSRIVSIADYFDTLISGQKGVAIPYEKAYEDILNNSDKKFDPDMVKLFKQIIQVYVDGSYVILSDNKHAIIKSQNQGSPLRPNVVTIPDLKEISLLDDLNLKIQRVVY